MIESKGELFSSKWNSWVSNKIAADSNGTLVSIYDKILLRFEEAHSQICSLLALCSGEHIPPITLKDIQDSVVLGSGRVFPSTSYPDNPIRYTNFSPFKPPILNQVWTLDDGSAPSKVETDADVLKPSAIAPLTPKYVPKKLQDSKKKLQLFLSNSLSYLECNKKIRDLNLASLEKLNSLISLEETSKISNTIAKSAKKSLSPNPLPEESYSDNFITEYNLYLHERSEQLNQMKSMLNSEAEDIHNLYFSWIVFYSHKVEGVFSKLQMSKLSLNLSEDSLNLFLKKKNFF